MLPADIDYRSGNIPYAVNNSAATGTDHEKSGLHAVEWIWVSMDDFANGNLF